MRTSNSKAVYKKLTKVYGNSLQNVLRQNSAEAYYDDEYTKDPYLEKAINQERKTLYKQRSINQAKHEPIILAGTLFSLEKRMEDSKEDEMVFFTEDFLECDEHTITSKRLQRNIEHLAQKVTRSIINSREKDKIL